MTKITPSLGECLFLENLALKLVLEHRAVLNWQKLVDWLMEEEELMSGVVSVSRIFARSWSVC